MRRQISNAQAGRFGALAVLAACLLMFTGVVFSVSALAADPVRIAVLKFGTASWELDVIKRHGFAAAEGIQIESREYAGPQATLVALQGGEADLAVADWLWVTRQRDEGRPFAFVPYSTAIGSVMVPKGSAIKSLSDLKGKRVGIAGGPRDKNWLLTRTLMKKQFGVDPEGQIEPVYGAPPMLNAQIEKGRLDAVITHWPYAARLRALGYGQLLDVREAIGALGIKAEVPMLGYVFEDAWAGKHRDAALGFFRAVDRAKTLLKESDQEWEAVRPLMGVEDDATFAALRDTYRSGIPKRWGDAERQAAGQLFELLREVGGRELVGKATSLAAGTFWDGISY